MSKLMLLDCTLRDGGYINDWRFGRNVISSVCSKLSAAKIDIIEVGFLTNLPHTEDNSLYAGSAELDAAAQECDRKESRVAAMIAIGEMELDPEVLLPAAQSALDIVRITFHNNDAELEKAFRFARTLTGKGYQVCMQPVGTTSYTDKELLDLIAEVNTLEPYAFYLVDTLGILQRKELQHFIDLIDHNLAPGIKLGFHSHNNLQMSFAHAQTLIEAGMKRPLIIDTSLRGMGRGAGNLCTELLLQYLNDSQDKQYNLVPLLVIIDEFIDKIHSKTPWGYNLPYYLAASLRCHPNYAAFLSDKGTVPIAAISDILSSVPEEKKSTYDKLLIQKLYLTYLADKVDDSQTLRKLQEEIGQRTVLLLGPGSTMYTEREKILNYIAENNPYIVSVNFRPKRIAVDKVFISNIRRFEEQSDYSNVIITSNIKNTNLPQLDYSSYLNDSAQADSALLMILQVLIRIGIKSISCAGMDGYGEFKTNFYRADISAQPIISGEDRRNEDISAELQRLSEKIGIHFITTTRYRLS